MSGTKTPPALTLPSIFPHQDFIDANVKIAAKIPESSDEKNNFLGGCNGVVMRLHACSDYSDAFIDSLRRVGSAPQPAERYQQDRQLFGFFVSGFSALDSFFFWSYFAAACLNPKEFPSVSEADIKSITITSTTDKFKKHFSKEKLAHSMDKLISDPEFENWKYLRNLLAHRVAPGRYVFFSTRKDAKDRPSELKISKGVTIVIDEKLTATRLNWLLDTLVYLVMAAKEFANKYF